MLATAANLARAKLIIEELARREAQNRFFHVFPDATHEWRGETYYSRDLYPRHMAFLAATSRYLEVGFMAANRVGKTWAGGYAAAVWLTGLYPWWWQGRVFDGPVDMWVAGKTMLSTRDILQHEFFGDVIEGPRRELTGTGLIPGGKIVGVPTWHSGSVAHCVDTVRVRHVSGGVSTVGFRAYEQGRRAFEGTAKDVVLFDEECPSGVLGEAMTRLMTKRGVMLHTFTPLDGMSDVAMRFVPGSGTQ